MDKSRISGFWLQRSRTHETTRWTSRAQLDADLEVVKPHLDAKTVLDLGAGTGELLQPFANRAELVTAVDMVPAFLGRIPEFKGLERVVGNLETFVPSRRYELVLMFGVVTHLSVDDESKIYGRVAGALSVGGRAIIKHQCSDGAGFTVDRPPTAEDTVGYVGRYPAVEDQVRQLGQHFTRIEVTHYPESLRRYDNSHDCAFVCWP